MQIKTYNVYKYDELTKDQQQKAVTNLSDINTDCDWWDGIYSDAKDIGLTLEYFNLDRNRHATGKFSEDVHKVAENIKENHGEMCDTYRIATDYVSVRDALVKKYEDKNKPDHVADKHLEIFDEQLDIADAHFETMLIEAYSVILQKDYEYLVTEEAIIETIQANDYNFTSKGVID